MLDGWFVLKDLDDFVTVILFLFLILCVEDLVLVLSVFFFPPQSAVFRVLLGLGWCFGLFCL